ncbi:MAG: UDP-N-acetylglucosamine--N-acetylmuramyl-(pentapeptide) pyrophosphoryl-undecaprenol N-acetylglucosamine transferase [bacterium]
MKILFTGGGTGGHILPILAIVREIRYIYSQKDILEIYYVGPRDPFVQLLSEEGVIVRNILAGKIRRYFDPISILQNVFDVFVKIPIGLIQALFQVFIIAPDVIFSKGGYGSVPVTVSGWIMQVPIFMHESDVSPGMANRWLGQFAKEIFVSFPIRDMEFFPTQRMISVGNPIRHEIINGSENEAKKIFGLVGDRPLLLIIGGSQGARKINETILDVVDEMLMNFEIIHQTGNDNFNQVSREARVVIVDANKKYYHPYPFLDETQMANAYKAATIIVGRSGSGTIFEIAANGKPSVLIPLPGAAQNHQAKNAYSYSKWRGAIVIEQDNLSPHFFLEKLKALAFTPGKLEYMGKQAKEFSRPQAARIIAEYLLAYLR